jgi:ABC-type polysaccharide/polyol phosphate transport system ATPase subunit
MNSPTASESAPASPTGDAQPVLGDPVIRVENVTVRYKIPRERTSSIKDYAIRRLKGQIEFDEFLALKNVSLDVRRGETLGIIGHNGAGKSTLLRLIARVLRPSEGRVWVRGTVAPLLELGAGFDPELTGRENIYLNGTMLGQTLSNISSRLDRIIEFAGIREFIDMPLRTYSTGMAARLGFAVATDVQPDILIIDELLSVGDAEFQRKSSARMEELRKHGDAILMVSHGLESVVELCHRVVWLHHGEIRALGEPAEIVAAYRLSAS